ncbi:hypothetical protein ACSBR2_005616 [Camellia fascicularis]
MKDPFLYRRRRPNHPKKLKLVCSFNGTFLPRPPSGNLRYTGGETRIVSVERNIGFSRLRSKISDLSNGLLSFSLKYQLPINDNEAHLVLITSDDDVRCMIDEFDKLESLGKPSRLWIFVCNNDNVCVYRHENCVETENLNDGSGVSCINCNGFGGLKSVSDRFVNGDGFESRNLTMQSGGKVKNGVRCQCSDDSLRKMVLKQGLLPKESAFHGGLGLAFDQTEIELESGNQKFNQPFKDLTSEPQGPLIHETRDLIFVNNPYWANTLDYEFKDSQFQRSENLGINSLPVSHSHPLNPRDGNLCVETNSFTQRLTNRPGPISSNRSPNGVGGLNMDLIPCSGAELRNLDRENIMPWSGNYDRANTSFVPLSCSNQLVASVYPTKSLYGGRVWGGFHNGIRNHRFAANDMRNQRTCSYHVRNHRIGLTEMGSHRNARLEERPWVGKFYPRLRSSSYISKQGQAMRFNCPSLWKPWCGYHDHNPEEIGRMMDSGLNDQTYSFNQPYKENFTEKSGYGVPQPEVPNPSQCRFAYNGMGGQSLLPTNTTKNPLTSTRAMDSWEDLLNGSNGDNKEVPSPDPCKNLHRVAMSSQPSCDFKIESLLVEPIEAINISSSPNNLGFRNGTELEYNGKLSKIESSVKSLSNHHSSARAIQAGLASLVDLSLCNLCLSSSKEVEAPAHSSPTCNDSKALVKPQSNPLDLMDEENLSSGPRVDTSNGVVSESSSQNAAKLENVNEQKEEMRRDHPSSLSNEKAYKESHKCSKENGSIPTDLIFYTHLASRELQTIKNSDLEYIKELGSGTYGTVFYGKWKGCDVAIKKLKPSCFTDGAPEHDRLVADYWKEAHILGQLHHPHIVAFYGVVMDGPVTNLATVTEYMVNGSLKQVLQRKDRTIDRRKRLIIAMDAAFGMEYLHEKNIVHFDLKSHNFLVNMRDPQRPVCKIGDLGLSKIKQRTLVSGGIRGTIPWMAPELLNSKKNMVTEKVDVYSFGIVMWELLTGEEPYRNMRSEEIIAGIIKGNLHPEIPSWCDPAWRSLMERCWSSDPDSRPAFSEIAKELRAMSAAMNIK